MEENVSGCFFSEHSVLMHQLWVMTVVVFLAETEVGCELSMKLLTLRRSLTLLENDNDSVCWES